MPSTTPLDTLLGLREVLNLAVETVAEEWQAHGFPASLQDPLFETKEDALPSPRLYEATKRAIGAADMLQALLRYFYLEVLKPSLFHRLDQYFESRALHAASMARIPDILHQALLEGKPDGLTAQELSEKTGYEKNKCGMSALHILDLHSLYDAARIMRLLATNHIFNQTGPERFSNNRTSAALINNPPLANYIDLYGAESYASSQHLLAAFKDESLALESAAFARDRIYNAQGKTYWEYNDENSERHDKFATAMAGSAQTNLPALLNDYPWFKLEKATIVDVGGGIGTLSLPLLQKYRDLSVVIQDRESVIAQATEHWKANFPTAIEEERVVFQVADFFQPNEVHGAEVYMLRYIIDDWNDDACVTILSAIKASMSEKSKVLIVEALLIPAWLPSSETSTLTMAPDPLLPNYGLRFISLRNGTERTVSEMTRVVERAGLVVEKIWECRSAVHITQCALP
ncbi:S-adenosyl-L-methionine-dependent methyltransferase [Mycena sanguinolenta]|uniref:S-adenosyl-L-methionine-dependent methyltransferase n=1 Tax=Mycena sanguinolenta TaxID=230812 RepID=A0A8H6Y2G0_9AGAR|nr:S-adenosyl-L-methionine-dependent methyltransferase [Mycena sanguinolenta]